MQAHTLELLRDPRSIVALGTSFLGLIGLLWGVDALISTATGTHADLLLGSIPLITMIGLMTISFTLTTVPLVKHRSGGILQTLGVTPAHRGAYLLGHVPVRVGTILTAAAVLLGIACVAGRKFFLTEVIATIFTITLGGAMLLSIGYLIGARLTNLNTAMQLAYILPVVALATSGVFFPLSVLPTWLATSFRFLPTTWLAEALTATLTHSPSAHFLGLTWGMMGAATVVASISASKLYRWVGE